MKKDEVIEIRVHGRGGQGAVTASQIIAIAAFYDGYFCQAFPMFGLERAGSPVQAFARISKSCINKRTNVYTPDYSLVLDASLLEAVDVCAGLKEFVIINTSKDVECKEKTFQVNATDIAMKIMGKPFVNVAMVGAFAKKTGLITLKSVNKAIDDIFKKTKGPKVAELNKKVVKEVYDATK